VEATMQCSSCDVQFVIVDGRPAVRGECDLASADRIEQWLATFDGDPLEIDLSGVTFFDAAALHALLNARQRNPHIRVVQPSRAVSRVLELTATVDYLVDGRDLVIQQS
jgi:stage II sporulation protein AA (anti-sigma F factor antagonist)